MSGKKGRSGRRRNIISSIRETLEAEDSNLGVYLDNLWEIASDKTKSPRDRLEASKYCIDRELGRTKATTNLSLGRIATIDAQMYEYMCKVMDANKQDMLERERRYLAFESLGTGYIPIPFTHE